MINIIKNNFYTGKKSDIFNADFMSQIRAFHYQIDGYQPTPLVSLPLLAKRLGVKTILVKDESHRFGLKAYKGLGGSYALGQLLAEHLNVDIAQIDLKTVSEKLNEPLVFTTATAGNHGTGVAWAAQKMGQKAVVYMPMGSPMASVERIRKLGAECIVTDVNYDDTVRLARKTAEENGWILVQDTAWEGYEKIPTWISQGYMTMPDEALEQAQAMNEGNITHVMLQAGVGSMAGGVLGYLVDKLGVDSFKTIIAEPDAADCLYRSGNSADGDMVNVAGKLDTIMAGLACGEPNSVTWPVLKDNSSYFASVEDSVSATGMRVLGNPLSGDTAITSGESGAITLGLLYKLCSDTSNQKLREELGLNQDSTVLIFNTEGDTNPSRYRDIVWDARH